jgi:hypothetical protein
MILKGLQRAFCDTSPSLHQQLHIKTFKVSLPHVSAHYVPSSGSITSQVLKPTITGVYTLVTVHIVCADVDCKIKLKCGYNDEVYSVVHRM